MSDPKAVPQALFAIPDVAPPRVRLRMRVQMVIQAAFYAFGYPDARPGTQTLNAEDFLKVLNMATAMLLSADRGLRTRQAVRQASEDQAKRVRALTEALQGDTTVEQMLAMLGMTRSAPN